MQILLLGGIGEAVRLARGLTPDHGVIYSIAGKGRRPELPGPVRSGGFGGSAGLATFLREQGIERLIDATHPYAAQMSRNAVQAARLTGVSLWVYRRLPWRPESGDDWRFAADWPELLAAVQTFQRPLFTIGLEPLRQAAAIPPHQHWLARCLEAKAPNSPQLTILGATGPFTLEAELALLRDWRIDVLVAKNSGGDAVAAKLEAARQLQIPVILLERPALPAADREFATVDAMLAAFQENGGFGEP
ncbi:MAG: cobalt-precorrin-6A reductase [Candidatus Contendobacter sp.]|jgi:precorrin-6A/cobalt-precorrin-6A reductase|nr:cobalt-precorrin-6A reductase [Candidatus Contendobacter sp.]